MYTHSVAKEVIDKRIRLGTYEEMVLLEGFAVGTLGDLSLAYRTAYHTGDIPWRVSIPGRLSLLLSYVRGQTWLTC